MIRSPDEIHKTLIDLEQLWLKYPELRLGQLIELHNTGVDTFYIEDSKLIQSIDRTINLNKN